MLAPFLDGMVTPDIEARFTAAEALAFLENFRRQRDAKVLAQRPIQRPNADYVPYDHWDRWAGLPGDFVREWSAYRIPPPSYRLRLLRMICEYVYGWHAVTFFRKLARRIKAIIAPAS